MSIIGHITLKPYGWVMQLAQPCFILLLFFRRKRGKENAERQKERFGHASTTRPNGTVIWVHAASVGETNSVLPLCAKLSKRGFHILLTTATATAAKIVSERGGDIPKLCHQYAPLDIPSSISRFLNHWKPELALFVESEIWPVTIRSLNERKIPIVIINGRMSDRSFKRWKALKWLAFPLFKNIDYIMARGEEDLLRFQDLGCRKMTITGNLKYDSPMPKIDNHLLQAMKEACHQRPFFLAASTHKGEEEHIIAVHNNLKIHHPSLLTCIVPRHPKRASDIMTLGTKHHLNVEQRTQQPVPSKACDIYIADTLGELGLFYSLSNFALIGGSLAPIGGHNPIEAIQMNCAIISGLHIFNFREIYGILNASQAYKTLTHVSELTEIVHELLNDPFQCADLAHKAHQTLQPLTGAIDQTLQALEPFLSPIQKDNGRVISLSNHTAA